MTTQTLTFYGDTGGHAFDGFAGFRIGQPYELTYTEEGDEVLVQMPHAPGRTAKMSKEDFKKWFRK
jgi:hypothetical protein